MPSLSLRKILWALEPSDSEAAAKLLQTLTRRTRLKVEAAMVLSPQSLNLPIETESTQDWMILEQSRGAAQKALARKLAQVGIPGLSEGTVLVEPSSSLRKIVDQISQHAERIHADAVLITTHQRSAIPRLWSGSFAESLIRRSRVPALILGESGFFFPQPPETSSRLLYATDLSQASYDAFKAALPMLSVLADEIRLCHILPNPIEPMVQSGVYLLGGGWVPSTNFFLRDESRRRALIERWARFARSRGVRCQGELRDAEAGTAQTLSIIAEREGAWLLCLAAEHSSLRAVTLGSVLKDLIRRSTLPILVLHAQTTTTALLPRSA